MNIKEQQLAERLSIILGKDVEVILSTSFVDLMLALVEIIEEKERVVH